MADLTRDAAAAQRRTPTVLPSGPPSPMPTVRPRPSRIPMPAVSPPTGHPAPLPPAKTLDT